MNTHFMKKSGLVTSFLARDFFVIEAGERIPSVAEYARRFSVSRGIVQDSLAFLEAEGAVAVRREGARGTFLTGIQTEALQRYTGWDALTGTMPLPLNQRLSSLATAINHEIRHHVPMPGSFAYISGAGRRMQNLAKMMYDFVVVSLSSAQLHLQEYDFLETPIVLDQCYYSSIYFLYYVNPAYTEITDGMRVVIDPTSTDQYTLTKLLFRDKQVQYVEMPYIGFMDAVTNDLADCMVYRQEPWLEERPWIRAEMIEAPGFSIYEMVTPAILIHRDNYGLKRLLEKYMDPARIRAVQREALDGKRGLRIY